MSLLDTIKNAVFGNESSGSTGTGNGSQTNGTANSSQASAESRGLSLAEKPKEQAIALDKSRYAQIDEAARNALHLRGLSQSGLEQQLSAGVGAATVGMNINSTVLNKAIDDQLPKVAGDIDPAMLKAMAAVDASKPFIGGNMKDAGAAPSYNLVSNLTENKGPQMGAGAVIG